MKKLNIVINGFESDWGARIIEAMLRPFQLGFCLIFCRQENVPHLQADTLQWHSLHEFQKVDWNTIRPLDEKLIEDMRDCEAVMMELMSRHERGGRIRTYQERKRWYLMHLRYWNHILEEKRIDVFLCNHTPHHDRTYMIYCLCQKKNIPVLFFHFGPIRDSLFLVADWEKSNPTLRDRYVELRQIFASSDKPVPLAQDYEAWYQSQLAKDSDPTPWFMSERLTLTRSEWLSMVKRMLLHEPLNFLRHTAQFVLRPLSLRFWKRFFERRKHASAFSFYDAHTQAPDLNVPYVYVALHMQPECTTCPLGGAFSDQLLMVQLLASCVPEGTLLYVKEHPKQESRWRQISLYEDLLNIPSVRLMPRTFSTFRLAEHATAVATVTGTVVMESLIRQKPVYMFGHDYQQYAPGVWPIHRAIDCQNATTDIFQKKVRPNLRDVRIFLKAVEDVAVRGHINASYKQMSAEENEQSLATAIQAKIREYYPDAS